jgi:recombination protein RecR
MKQNKIDKLIYIFSKLPGLGSRSAKRVVLHLIKYKDNLMLPLSDALLDTANAIEFCKACGNLDEGDTCRICADPNRNQTSICIVETVADLWALEKSNVYKGLYHILGGTLSAFYERTPNEVNIDQLVSRIENSKIEEVIIATNATLDGQTTAFYITEKLRPYNIKVSRLASGIPIGGELDYLDEGTITAAFNLRQKFD